LQNTIPKQRLFFALYPDAAERETLAAMARLLLPAVKGKFVTEDNLHFTLVFLGSIAAETRQCLEQMAKTVSSAPLTLLVDKIGYWRKPKVIWAGATQLSDNLLSLVEQLRTGGAACGADPDTRPYEAHLTLVRKVNRHVAEIGIDKPVRLDFDRFSLMESVPTADGVHYTTVASWPLAVGEAS
jgi:2'-5' RNA ligase